MPTSPLQLRTPRRVCSVHPARPLACREYYYNTCKKRWTGELAVSHALGYEALRDRHIDAAAVERALAECGAREPAEPIGRTWSRAFWLEMRRALRIDDANEEGAADPQLPQFQVDPDRKLDRLLSKRNLRFEEKYGPEPSGEQLDPYAAGRSMLASDERARLLRIATMPPPSAPLFTPDDYPYHAGTRWLLAGADPGMGNQRGQAEPMANTCARAASGEAAHAAADAIARATQRCAELGGQLLAFAHHVASVRDLMELEPVFALPLALHDALRRFPQQGCRRAAAAAWRRR